MRYEMKMPDLAANNAEITVSRWIVEPGQKVARGQPLLDVETDKAVMQVESVASGVVSELCAPAGASVAVGQVIAVIEVDEKKTAPSTGR